MQKWGPKPLRFTTRKLILRMIAIGIIGTNIFIACNQAPIGSSTPTGSLTSTPYNSGSGTQSLQTPAPGNIFTTEPNYSTPETLPNILSSPSATQQISPQLAISDTPTPLTSPKPLPLPNLAQSMGKSWQLVFSDDFNSNQLDTHKWTTCYVWNNNGCTNSTTKELEWYLPENIQVNNKALNLIAEKKNILASDGKRYAYSSGMITSGKASEGEGSQANFSFTYGFVEMRAKIPKGNGLWPAFWMLPVQNGSKPEIDIMEAVGNNPNDVIMTIHYRSPAGEDIHPQVTWTSPVDLSEDWHTYAVDWEPDHITWYVDGIERFRFDEQSHIPSVPMYLLLNLAVGGFWIGYPDATTPFPSVFTVDYVRVWQSTQ